MADMANNNQIRLLLLLAFVSILFIVDTKTTYVVLDIDANRSCVTVPPPNSKICDFKDKVINFTGKNDFLMNLMRGVNITIESLGYIAGVITDDCKDWVRNYSCANMFPKCTDRPGNTPQVTLRVKHVKDACKQLESHCPKEVYTSISNNCTKVVEHLDDYRKCKTLTPVKDPVCKTIVNNKYPRLSATSYNYVEENVKNTMTKMAIAISVTVADCKKNIEEILCNVQLGPFCKPGKENIRMFPITKKYCHKIMKDCLIFDIDLFHHMCDVLPDVTSPNAHINLGK